VWSRGFALTCDHNGGLPFVRGQRGDRRPLRFDARQFARVRDGDLVWTRLTALPQFLSEALPRIRARFTLVTGDEDWSIPTSFAGSEQLLESPKLLLWFTQNLDPAARSPKLHPLPIGVDFHTISNGPQWGQPRATPAVQEADLAAMRAQMPPAEARLLLAHADFHFNLHPSPTWGDERRSVQSVLQASPAVHFQAREVSRSELWREKMRHAFVVSPHGRGLDCHRTWESLLLGNIVIVKASSLDPLYEGLPVVIVRDWREVTLANLARWRDQHAGATTSPEVEERLTSRFWMERMRRMTAAALAASSL